MVGNGIPCQLLPVGAGDLPLSLTNLKPDLRCSGFRVTAGTGTVSVTMQAPGEAEASTRVLPCPAVGTEWRGEFLSIAAFDTVTAIWVYLTDVHS